MLFYPYDFAIERYAMKNIILFLFFSAAACSGLLSYAADSEADSITKQYEAKADSLKKKYDDSRTKLNDDTIKKYEALLKKKTKEGDLNGALEIKNKIDALKDDTKLLSDEEPSATGDSLPDSQTKAEISDSYIAFHEALMKNNIKAARSYVDPEMVKAATPKIIDSYIGVMVAYIQAAKLSTGDVKTYRIILGKNRKDAKVIGKYKSGMKWHPQKPCYWVQRNGQWYLGDEKLLETFK